MKYDNGSESVLSRFPFAQLVKVRNVPCSDGKRRTTCRVSTPDTFFSVPAAVRVKGKTVAGFLTCEEDGWKFTANQYGKNGAMLPRWKDC